MGLNSLGCFDFTDDSPIMSNVNSISIHSTKLVNLMSNQGPIEDSEPFPALIFDSLNYVRFIVAAIENY